MVLQASMRLGWKMISRCGSFSAERCSAKPCLINSRLGLVSRIAATISAMVSLVRGESSILDIADCLWRVFELPTHLLIAGCKRDRCVLFVHDTHATFANSQIQTVLDFQHFGSGQIVKPV